MEYIQRQFAGFLGIGSSTEPVNYSLSKRVWDMRDTYPANVLQIADGLRLSFETQIASGGTLTLPLPPAYDTDEKLFVSLRSNVLVKVVTQIPIVGTSAALLRPGAATDQNGVHSFVSRATSITVTNPSAATATVQYTAFQLPDLELSTSWRDGYQTTGVYRTTPTSASTPVISRGPTMQKFIIGSGTYVTPAGVSWIRVRMVGAGGGGGGSSTVAANDGVNGTDGGASTFSVHLGSAFLTASGGGAGKAGAGQDINLGGSATIVSPGSGIAIAGTSIAGTNVSTGATGVYWPGGNGAPSAFGGAGGGHVGAAGSAGATNSGSGGGGGGCANAGPYFIGSGGAAGGFIDAIITTPAASYDYSVGAVGAAGTAGTGGFAGAVGGAGYIVVEENY